MKPPIALLIVIFALSGLETISAESRMRYHAGLHICVDAPAGECVEGMVACTKCNVGPPAEPVVVTEVVELEALARTGSSSRATMKACYRKELKNAPRWISAATWVDSRSEIMVVDPAWNQVLLYTVTGVGSRLPTDFGSKNVESTAHNTKSYIIKMLGPSGMLFSEDLGILEPEIDFQRNRLGGKNGLGSLYDWITDGDRLFAFGTVRRNSDLPRDFASGFIDAEIGGKPLAINDVKLRVEFDYLDYYLLGHRYVATAAGDGFFLKMGSAAEIFRFSKKTDPPVLIHSMPKELAEIKKIKNPARGPADIRVMYEEVASYQLPVGIYGYGDKLYLLGRFPVGRKTIWRLYKIDPVKQRVMAILQLPLVADHLTVVPAPNFWFFFEKGGVNDEGTIQEIKTLVAIPSEWIVGASSPLVGGVTCISQAQIEG
jgi:hypothetical protein